MDIKTELKKAANQVGVAESAADLIADHLIENGIEVVQGEKPKPASELKVQPAAKAAPTAPAASEK